MAKEKYISASGKKVYTMKRGSATEENLATGETKRVSGRKPETEIEVKPKETTNRLDPSARDYHTSKAAVNRRQEHADGRRARSGGRRNRRKAAEAEPPAEQQKINRKHGSAPPKNTDKTAEKAALYNRRAYKRRRGEKKAANDTSGGNSIVQGTVHEHPDNKPYNDARIIRGGGRLKNRTRTVRAAARRQVEYIEPALPYNRKPETVPAGKKAKKRYTLATRAEFVINAAPAPTSTTEATRAAISEKRAMPGSLALKHKPNAKPGQTATRTTDSASGKASDEPFEKIKNNARNAARFETDRKAAKAPDAQRKSGAPKTGGTVRAIGREASNIINKLNDEGKDPDTDAGTKATRLAETTAIVTGKAGAKISRKAAGIAITKAAPRFAIGTTGLIVRAASGGRYGQDLRFRKRKNISSRSASSKKESFKSTVQSAAGSAIKLRDNIREANNRYKDDDEPITAAINRKAIKTTSQAAEHIAYQSARVATLPVRAPAKAARNAVLNRLYKRRVLRAQRAAQATRGAAAAASRTARIVNAVKEAAVRAIHKSIAGIVGIAAGAAIFLVLMLSTCAAVGTMIMGTVLSTTYLASDQDIHDADLYWTDMETLLLERIENITIDYPDYDEYRYDIDLSAINHDPFELISFLSAMFQDFKYEEGLAELLEAIFNECYRLELTETVEEYPVYRTILTATLAVTPFADVIAPILESYGATDTYNLYMETLGGRQTFGSPFAQEWLSHVSSLYGYRIHPISGAREFHRGLDIALPGGTPIQAVHDGVVVSAYYSSSYGNVITIESEDGKRSLYAHCSSIAAAEGQAVSKGDVIAYVGTTGSSTGNHLHIEIMLNGQHMNPIYVLAQG
jgi:hypothetical protein